MHVYANININAVKMNVYFFKCMCISQLLHV